MKILGLDLGPTSIGWALIEANEDIESLKILGMGSRVILYSDDTTPAKFSKGQGVSPCSERTLCRQMRRNIDRFQLHREQLKALLLKLGVGLSDFRSLSANPLEVWKTRADAATPGKKISLEQLSAVLLHINHRRGYKHAKSDIGDSKQTDYLARINERYADIRQSGKTVGQYFYDKLKESESLSDKGKKSYSYRIKEQVCPRQAYEEEVDRILEVQSEFYPEILTAENQKAIKQVIFYQRPLKSCKDLVSYCEFERHVFLNKDGKKVDGGPKVTPRTSPLAQVCRIYEAINNIRLVKTRRQKQKTDFTAHPFDGPAATTREVRKLMPEYHFTDEERQLIFDFLNTHEKMTEKDLLKLLALTSADGFKSDKALGKGIQGNTTFCQIANALGDYPDRKKLLRFEIVEEIPENNPDISISTGEILPRVSPDYIHQPLYMLWHTLYSIKDKVELFKVLSKKFGIKDSETLERLYALDFVKAGYANKSAKFIRKLVPLLRHGMMYSEACDMIGKNHSNSLTKEENEARELLHRIPLLHKGDLRQPVVEKILNQTINVVNAIIDEYGEIDEARVELARELKKDKEGREMMANNIARNERENQALAEEIKELKIVPTRRRIQKMKMLKETGNTCIYCGKTVTPYRFIEGHGYDIEHIIPRSRLFDDSFSNKACACRECNAAKGAQTAFDFMKSRSEQEFNSYLDRVENLYKSNMISRAKRDRLLMSASDIPEDFIERDLRETQYITRKSMEILSMAIRNVRASSGLVTDFFRHAWGYDTILHEINLPRYEAAGLAEQVDYETHGQKHSELRIKDWSKRKDHRHHALDALVVALTRQSYIQRLNTLNASSDNNTDSGNRCSLDKWAAERPHIDRQEVITALENVAVSFKGGKKITTPGKRYVRKNGKRVCVQENVMVPRSPLHKETIYGRIKVDDGLKTLKYALQNINLVENSGTRQALVACLRENGGDIPQTIKSLKKHNLEINGKSVENVRCFKEEFVVRYPLESIKYKDLKYFLDPHIRGIVDKRFSEIGNSDKDFAKSLAERPLYSDKDCRHRIRTVRLLTGLKASTLAGVRRNESGEIIGFAQTRNNHHVAFYRCPDGKIVESVVSFWDCVKRKQAGLPPIIKNPAEAWNAVLEGGDSDRFKDIAETLPPDGSEFIMSLQRNEMVVLGMSEDEWNDAVASNNITVINRHLYRVWKLGSNSYCFKFQTNTSAAIEDGDKEIKQFYIIQAIPSLIALHPRKVSVSLLGKFNNLSNDKESPML